MRRPASAFSGLPIALGRVGIVLVAASLVLGGCTVTSFLGRQFTNFTAYYNKFHNANAAFEEGLASIEEREQTIDRTQYISVFLSPAGQGNESAFDEAIQKSADVLREHPNSKWVDDALLLIGKSYFYQQNYVGAAQKFREVTALAGERRQEARFWLARTLVSTERYEEATDLIRTGIEEEGWGPWTARLSLVRGQLLTRQEQWEAAARALNQGLQGDLPGDVAARAAFLLGQTLETIDRPAPARAAYRQVQKNNPSYALSLAARLNDIELQGTHDNPREALDRLRDLETDDKNYDQRGEMAVVRARIHRAQGQDELARETLRDVLYGEEVPSGASRGRLHYDLARLYRDAFKDFSRAAAHFDTASTALGSAQAGDEGGTDRRMPAAPIDAGTQADRYRDLATHARTVARLDSLLRLGRMSDREFQQYVAELRRQQQAEQEAQAEKKETRSRRLQSRGALAENRQGSAPAADTRTSDAGFLFHRDPARVQRGRRQFEQTWGERPLVDNWRRRVAIRSMETASAETDEGGEPTEQGAPSSTAASGSEVTESPGGGQGGLDLSAVPRDSASLAEMEAERTVARYELANALFLAASRPDSAATWYRRILQESGDHPVATRALYALAEAYRAQGDSTAARQTYSRLVDQYPDTDLATRARERLGRPAPTSPDNREVLADSAYAQAYDRWQQGPADTLLTPFLKVATRYPDTEAAPRALLAAGIVYWQQMQVDASKAPRRRLQHHLRTLRSPDSSRADTLAGVGTDSAEAAQVRSKRTDRGDSVSTARPDSVLADTDSSQRRGTRLDSMRSEKPPPDLSPAQADSSGERAPDSAGVSRQEVVATGRARSSDSTQQRSTEAPAPNGYAPLEALMTHLTERYPDAPQVSQARSILELIEERRAAADSLLADTAATDTTVTDAPKDGRVGMDTTVADTTVATTDQEDPSSEGGATPSEEQADADQNPLPAPTGRQDESEPEDEAAEPTIDREQGGWTLLVGTFSSSQEASTRLTDVGQRLGDQWPVELLKETSDGVTQYRLVVGQFRSKGTAAQAQKRVARRLPSQPQVWNLSKIGPRP